MKFAVIGDVMLDVYHFVEPKKISAEAPVPVCEHSGQEYRLGGAANVAANILAISRFTSVELYGWRGSDEASLELYRLLHSKGINDGLKKLPGATVTKTRTVCVLSGQQLLRVDVDTAPVYDEVTHNVIVANLQHLPKNTIVVFSDYGKGTVTPEMVIAVSKIGAYRIANCKPANLALYADVDLLVMNRAEALEFIQRPAYKDNANLPLEVFKRCEALYEATPKNVLITCGASGMYCLDSMMLNANLLHAPAVPTEVYDVTGAGDTVVATLACEIAKSDEKIITQPMLCEAAANAARVVAQIGTSVPLSIKVKSA